MIRSLRARLILSVSLLAIVFMLTLLPTLQQAFELSIEKAVEERLASDVSTLISVASVEHGNLSMPQRLPYEEFGLPDADVLGFIYDRDGALLWRSEPASQLHLAYQPRYNGRGNEFHRIRDSNADSYFVYDTEIDLLGGHDAALSIVTLQPTDRYDRILSTLRRNLYLWMAGALLTLLILLWLGQTWGFQALHSVSAELDEVEAGQRSVLSTRHPNELLRLTASLNRLLESERHQAERYKNTLDDLAHSLKTPLSLLQALSEDIRANDHHPDQAKVLQDQVGRMNQQIAFQLQRAVLRRSGLVRHSTALGPLVETLADALDKVYLSKTVHLVRDFDDALRIPLEQAALIELLGNLLENAYRFCLSEIRLCARHQAGGYLLLVEDDGPGVPEERRTVILKRGERFDTRYPGQGLGLSMAGDIVDSHGGTLTLDDSSLGGARFQIWLPDFA